MTGARSKENKNTYMLVYGTVLLRHVPFNRSAIKKKDKMPENRSAKLSG